jgi:hypothetical protein
MAATLTEAITYAENMIGHEGFAATLERIENAGKVLPVGSEEREILRRVYAHIRRLQNAPTVSAYNYQMGKVKSQEMPEEVKEEAKKSAAPRIGTFTVVMGEERITLRIKKHWDLAEAAKGNLVVYYFSGKDADRDYTGFAFLSPSGKPKVWNKFKGGSVHNAKKNALIITALGFLTQNGDYEGAGHTYALESGNCWRCGHTLVVPASIHRGLGPECAKKVA